jgi:hypothetical protein
VQLLAEGVSGGDVPRQPFVGLLAGSVQGNGEGSSILSPHRRFSPLGHE